MGKVKDVLDSLGLVDMDSITKYFNDKKDNLTQADIDILSPDVIDNKEFWQLATKLDSNSLVGGNRVKDNSNEEEIIYWNSILAKSIGIFDYIVPTENNKYKLLDIGCGYCPIKRMLKYDIEYTGIDIVARTPDVIEVDGNGIPDELGMFDYVVSCNVFQHLSTEQKIRYTHDAYQHLHTGAYFINAMMTSYGNVPVPQFNNIPHIFTCGQFHPLMSHVQYMSILYKIGFTVLQFNNRWDGFSCFICQKRGS